MDSKKRLEAVDNPQDAVPEKPGYDSNPPHGLIFRLFNNALFVINLTAFGYIGFNFFLLLMLYLYPSPVSLVAIVLVPMLGVGLTVISIIDCFFCVRYLLRNGKDTKKNIAALLGSLACIGVLGYVAYVTYTNIRDIYKIEHPNDTSAPQASLDRAAAAGYGFDMLGPNSLPNGYKWYDGSIHEGLAGANEIYSYIQYTKGSNSEIDVMTYSKRKNFTPPSDCGYYLTPVNDGADTPDEKYPCRLIGNTESGNAVYYLDGHYGEKFGEPLRVYYIQKGRNVVVLKFLKDSYSYQPNQNEVMQMMNSMTVIPVVTLVKNNAAAGK